MGWRVNVEETDPMKLTVDLPDWVEGKNLYVFAGMELAAYKPVGQSLMVKDSRCSVCGRCCTTKHGRCEHLTDRGECGLKINRPFACGLTGHPKRVKECTESYVIQSSDP